MISRFAELGSYVGTTLILVLFPLASEQHERDDRSQKLILQGMGLSLAAGLLLAAGFWLLGAPLFNLVAGWRAYAGYTSQLCVLTVICALRITACCFTTHEMACHRFGFLTYVGAVAFAEAAFLYGVTGYSFFAPWLPAPWIDWMASLRAARLEFVLGVMFWCSVLPLALMAVQLVWQRRQSARAGVLSGSRLEF